MSMLEQTLTFILAGGAGSRLQPLTAERAKPAVPFGGKYRIIDFTLANCLHSGLRQILVLTQYKSHSLQKHLRDGWSIFNPELGEYITTVPAQQRRGSGWYTGTADAIYQNLYLMERSGARWVLILSGDHIYRMDYAALLQTHHDSGADATVACMEVPLRDASAFGVVAVDKEQRVTQFAEKPRDPQALPDAPDRALVSMGIYLFSIDLLKRALTEDGARSDSSHDFGHDILPSLLDRHKLVAHRFGGSMGRVTPDRYWRDVGTIDAYYESNMDLLQSIPPLDLYQNDWPIRTYQAQTPPARTVPGKSGTEGVFINSIIAGGTIIAGGNVSHSILFPRVFIDDEATVENSILFEGVHIGAGARIQNAIIDKHVRIPDRARIGLDPSSDQRRFHISPAGIVVVAKGYAAGTGQ